MLPVEAERWAAVLAPSSGEDSAAASLLFGFRLPERRTWSMFGVSSLSELLLLVLIKWTGMAP